MSTVCEDRLDPDWKDYEGVIGYDPMTHKFHVQLNHHSHWFDDKKSAKIYLKDNK